MLPVGSPATTWVETSHRCGTSNQVTIDCGKKTNLRMLGEDLANWSFLDNWGFYGIRTGPKAPRGYAEKWRGLQEPLSIELIQRRL